MKLPDLEQTGNSSPMRAHLERGLRFEQAGTIARALSAYQDALAAAASPPEEAEARIRIARVRRGMAEWDDAISESRIAAAIAEQAGANDLVVEALNIELGVYELRGEFDEAEKVAARAHDRPQSPRVRGITWGNQANVAARRGDFTLADQYFGEAVDAFREAEYDLGIAMSLINGSAVARDRGQPARALELAREAAALCRTLNVLDVLLMAVQNQAAASVALGQLEDAEQLLTEALGYFTSARNVIRQAECLELLGDICELRPGEDGSRRFYARAADLATAAGDRVLADRLHGKLAGERGDASANKFRSR